MERLAQAETYYPAQIEGHTGVTAMAFGVCRLPDGFWYDFNDSTFKNAAWVTPYQAMAEEANPDGAGQSLWIYTTGWAIPDANSTYQVYFKITDATGTYYQEGPKIVVHASYFDVAADWINGGRLDLLLDAIKVVTDAQASDGSGLTALGDARIAELAAANLPADIDTLLTRNTEARLSELDAANIPTDLSTIDTVVDAIKAKTDNLPSGVAKNVALSNFEFVMVLTVDHITPATGKTLTEEISKDGGAFVACTNNSVEVGHGVYKIDITQAEMNADVVTLKFTEAACDQRTITIVTS